MNYQKVALAPGLYLVATPIGAARDITLRALDIIASADVLAAEDTRTARHLMEIHAIAPGDRPLVAYHDHNASRTRPRLLRALSEGRSVAYMSEAGTPLVSDPGFALARAAIDAGHMVTAAPGASAVLAALSVAGLGTDRFLFAGFLPSAAAARRAALAELRGVAATLVFYESPRRVPETLTDMCEVFGADVPAAICRELTKKFEETLRGTLGELSARVAEKPLKGEVVLVVDRVAPVTGDDEDVEAALIEAMKTMRVKDAAQAVAGAFGLPRRDVYRLALDLAARP